MGMTDKQFNAFLRFELDALMRIKQQALTEKTSDNLIKEIDNMIDLLNESMKD